MAKQRNLTAGMIVRAVRECIDANRDDSQWSSHIRSDKRSGPSKDAAEKLRQRISPVSITERAAQIDAFVMGKSQRGYGATTRNIGIIKKAEEL